MKKRAFFKRKEDKGKGFIQEGAFSRCLGCNSIFLLMASGALCNNAFCVKIDDLV